MASKGPIAARVGRLNILAFSSREHVNQASARGPRLRAISLLGRDELAADGQRRARRRAFRGRYQDALLMKLTAPSSARKKKGAVATAGRTSEDREPVVFTGLRGSSAARTAACVLNTCCFAIQERPGDQETRRPGEQD